MRRNRASGVPPGFRPAPVYSIVPPLSPSLGGFSCGLFVFLLDGRSGDLGACDSGLGAVG